MTDVHRIGFTQLGNKDARDGPYRANIVFVHGLRGHPRQTWEDSREVRTDDAGPATSSKQKTLKSLFKSKPSTSAADTTSKEVSAKLFWPGEFLAEDIPEARVWTYGYNADAIGGLFEANYKNSVSQHGRDFAVKIEREIENEDPIVFIAHSLGGIIVKDAIHRSAACRARTKLIVFLGTPHRGSSYASWGEIASNLARLVLQDSNKKIIETLEVNSEVLDNIDEEFRTIVHSESIKIHSFQEARGISGMKGLDKKVVDDFSSKLGLPRVLETVESIDADHMQMAKCHDRNDPRYRAIAGVLKQFMRSGLLDNNRTIPQGLPLRATTAGTRMAAIVGELSGSPSNRAALPCYHIPLRKNKRFVGREETLDALRDVLFIQGSQRAALVGLGGVGKTQVALEFAYWAKENKPEYSVFWVPALSVATFEQAYTEMARKLPVRKDSDGEDLKESVRRYLSSEAAGPWLLVVDNADDIDVLFGSSDTPGGMSEYIPEREDGLILFTTRSKEVALSVAGVDVVDLHEMSAQEATSLLESSLIRKDLLNNEATTELLDELTYLPVAITQAAAYLNRNQISIAEYLGLLRGTEKGMVGLMSREFHDSTRYAGSQNAVATTWLVSFEQIRKSDRVAADLLSFMSHIEPKAIPRSILPKLESEEQMVQAIGTLCGYAFLGRRGQGDMFDMHRLVHIAIRIWIEKHERVKETEIKAIQHLLRIFPSADGTNRELWRKYIPHALRILYRSKDCRMKERYDLFFRIGQCLDMDRRFKEAIRSFTEAYQWRKEHLVEEDDSRLALEHNLARAYLDDRRIKEAISMLEHVVTVQKKTLAEDNHSRLASEHELASAYLKNKRIKEAISMLEHVVTVQKKTLAEDDHSRLLSEHELANAYLNDKRIKEAISILEHVVAVEKKTLAEDDDFRLASEQALTYALQMANQDGIY